MQARKTEPYCYNFLMIENTDIVEAKGLENYQLYLKFKDGNEGTLDYSNLVGDGVFSIWNDPKVFENVHVSEHGDYIYWNENVDICADSLYLKVTGKPVSELFESAS